jgi:hypothetical protein
MVPEEDERLAAPPQFQNPFYILDAGSSSSVSLKRDVGHEFM